MKKILNMSVIIFFLLMGLSCTNDEEANQGQVIGTWELARIEDSQDGTSLPPNDGKPVRLNLKKGGGYDGVAGNNEIHGIYKVTGNTIVLTLYTTEVASSEWESMFINAINKTWTQNEYVIPFTVEATELILQYEIQSKMFFIKI